MRAGLSVWVGSNAIFMGVQLVTSMVLARLLTPQEMGIFGVAYAVQTMIWAIQNVGLSLYLVQVPHLDEEKLATVATIGVLQAVGLGLVVFALGWPLAWFLQQPEVGMVMRWLSLAVVLMPFENLFAGYLQRQGRFAAIAGQISARTAASCGVTLATAWTGSSYLSLVWGTLAGLGASCLIGALLLLPALPRRLSLRHWREVWTFGSWILVASTLTNASNRLTDVILGRTLSVAAVGLFGRAAGMIDLVREGILSPFTKALVSILVAERDAGRDVGPAFTRWVELCTGLFWPAFGGLGLLAGPLIYWMFGPQWTVAAPALSWLAAAAAIQSFFWGAQQLLTALGVVKRLARLEAVNALLGTFLFTLGALVSLEMAAASRVLTAIAWVVAAFLLCRRLASLRVRGLLPVYGRSLLVTSAALAPPAVWMTHLGWATIVPIPTLIAMVAASGGAWLVAVFLTRHAIRDELMRMLRYRLPQR